MLIGVGLTMLAARITRQFGSVRGAWRVIEPIRHVLGVCAGVSRYVVVEGFDGNLRIRLDPREHVGSRIYWYGIHSINEIKVLRRYLSQDMTFLDVGANIGEFTLIAAKLLSHGQVIAFEPIPRLARILRTNVDMNGLHHVHLVAAGLSHRKGRVRFSRQDPMPGEQANDGLFSLYPPSERDSSGVMSRVVRLDDVVRSLKIRRIDLIKLDIEGAELSALKGSRMTLRRFKPMLMIEINEEALRRGGASSSLLMAFLKRLGYDVRRIERGGRLSPTIVSAYQLPKFCNAFCLPR